MRPTFRVFAERLALVSLGDAGQRGCVRLFDAFGFERLTVGVAAVLLAGGAAWLLGGQRAACGLAGRLSWSMRFCSRMVCRSWATCAQPVLLSDQFLDSGKIYASLGIT
jgi:hypothetical protein